MEVLIANDNPRASAESCSLKPDRLQLNEIQRRLDALAERRLAGLSAAEQLEYFTLVELEARGLAERDRGT